MHNINLDWFSFWAGITPDRKAITTLHDDCSFTYGDIEEKGSKIASHLYEIGIKQGDRIGILAKNCIENIYLFAAAQKLGAILVPFNYRLTSYELSQLIKNAAPSILFYNEEFNIPKLDGEAMSISKVHDFESTTPLPEVTYTDETPIFLLYTSGSTGVPKGVLYTHRMMYWNSLNTSVSLGINSNTSALVCMPPFHTGGWNVLLTPVLHHGGHIILTDKFDAEQCLSALKKYKCNQFMAVPTMLKMIANAPSFEEITLGNLPYIIVGGEAMAIDLIKVYETKDISVRQGFGMTEAGPNLTSLHHDHSITKIGSIGKPNMYVNVKLVDELGNSVKSGELGELCFSGPVVMSSYWKKELESKQSIKEGWLRSGDIAIMDEQGYIYIKDRKKNMFISGGENVYPAEIEKTLLKHNDISGVVVLGVADEKWGEVGKAFVVARKAISVNELKEFCSKSLSKYKIPKHYKFIVELPLNSTGKIDRKALLNL